MSKSGMHMTAMTGSTFSATKIKCILITKG